MSALDPRIEAVRAQYGLERNDFWQIPQNKQWVAKHAALEIVAAKAGVEWSPPMVIQADTAAGIAVISVAGKMGNRSEWSIGEASAKNNKNAYPWAMAEKRAKDRVILKLAGIHGLVYSEDEADDFNQPVARQEHVIEAPQEPFRSSADLKRSGEWERVSDEIANSMNDVFTFAQFEELKKSYREEVKKNGWNTSFTAALKDLFDGYEEQLSARIAAENNDVATIKEAFPGARVNNETIHDGSGRELNNMEAAE